MKVLLALLLFGLAGCGGVSSPETEATNDADAAKTLMATVATDSGAVAALEKLGAVVTRNEHGEAVDVAFFNTRITDTGLARLTELTNLQTLSLRYNPQVTDAGLVHLEGLANLQTFSLMGHKITDAGLVHFKGLANLETLNLNVTKITDAGLVHLSGLSKLKHLNLSGYAITVSGLQQLKGLASLRSLTLACPTITGADLAKLRKDMPKCEIQRYGLGI